MGIMPSRISINKKLNCLVLHWKDGHESNLTFSSLRFACPCVECRGGHEKMSSKPPVDVFDQPVEDSDRTILSDVETVGSYGLSIRWEDGHSAGIYSWEYLRLLCPCENCRNSR